MTASQIVESLRARGVLVRSTTSGRHIIVQSPRCCAGERSEARLLVMPTTAPHRLRLWFEHGRHRAPGLHHVIRPPGQVLHRLAGLFSKRTRERILDPIIADMQLEYCEVLAEGRPRRLKLWLVQLRGWAAFTEAIFRRTIVGRLLRSVSRLVRSSRLV
jgi:hypothetical protein